MSFVTQLGPHLPFLRRYARALTGSQSSGDAYIKASLAALASDTDGFDKDASPRLALYKYFHLIWSQTGAQLEDKFGGETSPSTLTPPVREASANWQTSPPLCHSGQAQLSCATIRNPAHQRERSSLLSHLLHGK